MRQIYSIARKEFEGYFGSLLAIIFLGTFLVAVMFVFFTVEKFFARGISDVRPLFQWMPILLIFLLSALTMRQWSEEQRSGTLEVLLTLPVSPVQLVLGKFAAVMGMILIALVFTLPLPITVSLIGNLDWGPVAGGYLAAILMAGAYAAIGLFISSRTDNQIVALISTVLVGGIFYIIGSRGITDLTGGTVSEILWAIGTGSRFESIERGVVDLRDLFYYLSLTAIFLLANVISLDSMRWSSRQTHYRRNILLTAGLLAANLLLVNVWLYPLSGLRVDLTRQREFTVSQTTRDLLSNLQEPLIIRGYISEDTHPLLAPVIPEIRDMLREYEIASRGMVTADVVDPIRDPEIEAEANQTYGIRPMPFQISGRYESRVVNSYFDILVRYGDQSILLNFADLVEVSQTSTGAVVSLRNLEYDLTSAIKKVVFGFQSVDAILIALDTPVKLTLYITPDSIPEQFQVVRSNISKVATEIAEKSDGKLIFEEINPQDPGSPEPPALLLEKYGLQPYFMSLFSSETFFMHMVLTNGDEFQMIYPTEGMIESDVRLAIESALKRTSTGFLKVVGIWTPPLTPTQDFMGNVIQPISSYQLVTGLLGQEYSTRVADLSRGMVSSEVDVLVIIAPQELTDMDLYAIDQFLMRGGSVVVAANQYKVDVDQFTQSLVLQPVNGGIQGLLSHYGINLSDQHVMDAQNSKFPVTVTRDVGGLQVREIQAANYPYFVDVRADGMSESSPVVSNLPAVSMSWVSPVELDETLNSTRETEVLMRSSPQSWLRSGTDIQPDFQLFPEWGFQVSETLQSYPLAVTVQGAFESYFKDRPIPTVTGDSGLAPQGEPAPLTTLERSPGSARLAVIGSATVVDDFALRLSSQLNPEQYLNNLNFLQNTVDWSIEDVDLLSIRARGTAIKVLNPMSENQQRYWEIANYIAAMLMLVGFYSYWQYQKRNEQPLALLHTMKSNKNGEEKGVVK